MVKRLLMTLLLVLLPSGSMAASVTFRGTDVAVMGERVRQYPARADNQRAMIALYSMVQMLMVGVLIAVVCNTLQER